MSRLRRYSRDKYMRGGALRATNTTIRLIRQMVISGTLKGRTYVFKEDDRLDHIAAKYLGSAKLWWVLAATSGIGWGLQVPPGTKIIIPVDMSKIRMLVS